MNYYIYILQSLVDDSLYIGYTQSIEQRLIQHNAGFSKYTSKKIPWKVVYTETFPSKKEAIIRERFLKRQKNRKFYDSLINNYLKS